MSTPMRCLARVILAFLTLALVATVGVAAPTKAPPVTLGPKTLTGDGSPPTAYEFFLQSGSSWKGDIIIGSGVNYSLVIEGIDVTGVTGPAGRYVYFNLQDAESGSTFKHLGISARLQDAGAGGRALLQCYQSFTSEGLSSHGFNAGELTESFFDLRFDFTKASSGAVWQVTPYYRLSGGSWTLFFDGSFNGTVAFDFLGAKLAAVLDGGADGTLSFDNYYVLGPAPAKTYVDDAWIGYAYGTAVQFPGETDYRTFGIDAFAAIQNGVDGAASGGNVYVADGTYREQVEIAKDLTVSGGGGGGGIIESPDALTKFWGTNKPIVYVHDAGNVQVKNLVVDGRGKGNANYRFVGVGYHNAGGTIEGCTVKNIQDTPFSGAQHGVGIYVYNEDATSRSLNVWDNTVFAFQKNGMALMSNATTPLALDVTGNTVTGAGATGVTAQNGIQVGSYYGSNITATIDGNAVSGIGYSGASWVATSILTYYSDCTITGNTVTNGHVGIYHNYGSATITGNNLTISKIGSYADALIVSDPPRAVASPLEETGGLALAAAPMRRGPLSGYVVDVSGNTVVFSGPDNTGTYGIETYAGYCASNTAFTASHNSVTGFDVGMGVYKCTSSCDTGVFTSVEVHYNSFAGNTTYGMESNVDYVTVDATGNWWGDATGPYHASLNPGGLGDDVSDNIDFDPWMTGLSQISVVPSYDITNCTTPVEYTFHIDRAGVSEEARGYDVKFHLDDYVVTVAAPSTDIVEEDYLSSVGSTSFFAISNGGGTYTVSCAILGGSVGATGNGDLFRVALTPAHEGTSAISMVNLKLRDLDNAPLAVSGVGGSVQVDCTVPLMQAIVEPEGECYNHAPTFSVFTFRDDVGLDLAEYKIDTGGTWTTIFSGLAFPDTVWTDPGWELPGFGGSGSGLSEGAHTVYFRVKDDAGNWNGEGTPATYSWSFIKDTVAPEAPTDFVALPGHNKVHLTWTNPTGDASWEGVEIRRVGWTDYPEYGTGSPVVPEPSYPADETEGALVTQTSLDAFDDDPLTPRDIYYYAAFSYDCAGNYSAYDAGAADRSTSYWLGDTVPIPPGTYDGLVNLGDLARFSATFGLSEGGGGWDAEGDFGPTDDWSRFGIPEPDDVVDFEDLMIIAMNFQKVSPLGSSGLGVLASSTAPLHEQVGFRLVLLSREGDRATYALEMDNGSDVLKGFALKFSYGVGNELVEVAAASKLTGKGDEHFFGTIERETGLVEICVAALGVDVPMGYTGEVARVVVREANGDGARISSVDLRDIANRRDEVTVPGGGETGYVPAVSSLGQNHPNPFNPVTSIAYEVATAGPVRIDIYDVSGHLVRRLVDEQRGVGRHTATWDGRDGAGNGVHSGVYFYRMTAPGYTSAAKKMLLLK